ncbi:interferon-induced GTP-binding protein Mx [Cenococcum geophilum 1.58]|uniref:Interferon-induced GTP-binding protein Mx n=1 Tax=Cenococcum geophilum 1.58 TaxID=794803 RepID=A0ACC8EN26_9PEZI|nr:interferon-induced GTP-binding protein Mx [Cenococcum geophilum 1.58]
MSSSPFQVPSHRPRDKYFTMSTTSLQSQDHRDLLDAIDRLRSRGVSRYVDLPEIVVCGDQSSGKSSALEAILRMSFPAKDNLCTRFATELILRRDDAVGIKVSIIPGPERLADEKQRLSRFHPEVDPVKPDLGSVIEKAKEEMGLYDAKVFSTDILLLELSGPTQPHLTIVDLPGLFRAGNKDQSVADSAIVKEMVRSYMGRPRSIILVVVSAKSDINLQDVTELAQELDPKGTRTIGLITKPDTLSAGSDSEASYSRLAQNEDVVFRLGWHVLKNRSYETRHASSAERDNDEEEFFARGIWTKMDSAHLSVKSLRQRLSNVLKDQILLQLPNLIRDVELGITDCQRRLGTLGIPRTTFDERRRYLLSVSNDFSTLMKAAVDRIYNDPFFGSAKTEDGYQKRLRAVVQNSLTSFKDKMRIDGQTRVIVDRDPLVDEVQEPDDETSPREISRSDYIDEVKELMRRSRGCELPGTFNPLIIGELFSEQCHPWKGIALEAKDAILQAVFQAAQAILNHVAVDEVADGMFRIISERIDALKKNLDQKVTELLEPHYSSHPITYNHYLTDNVRKAQADRRRRGYETILKEFANADHIYGVRSVDLSKLLPLLEERTEVYMERHASDLAVDYMQAYYKVALKNVVDDVGVLAVEDCLLKQLPSLFHPESICDMAEEDINRLTMESEGYSTERKRCSERLAVLEAGLGDLKRLNKHRPIIVENSLSTSGKAEEKRSEDTISQPESSISTPASED